MLQDIRAMRAQGVMVAVVVAALDRLDRRLAERIRCRDELKAMGVAVHSVREGGEVSDLVANVLGAVAQEEVRRLGERVKASRDYVRERGFMPQGQAPWGYRWRPATELERLAGAPKSVLDMNDETAPYVREAFERAEATSIRQLVRWVHDLPAAARQGKTLAVSALARAIESPTYIARDPSATGDVLALPVKRWPALIDDQLWLRVQQAIASHQIHHRQASGRYLLTGFMRCPNCGGRITGRWTEARARRLYQCSHERATGESGCSWTARAEAVERPTLDQVRELLEPLRGDARAMARLRHLWRELQKPGEIEGFREQRITRLRRDADKARERLTNAAMLLVDGTLDRNGYELVRDASQGELRAAEEEIARLAATVERAVLPDFPEVLLALGQWSELLNGGTVEAQRELLADLVQQVACTKVGYGRYTVATTWTPLGEALATLSSKGLNVPVLFG